MVLPAFILMSLAWSFSWYASKLQIISSVALEVSIFYRMAVTSILIFILCYFAKQRLTINKKEFPYFIFIGLFNFCLNFIFGYYAMSYIPSGVVATMFSLSIIVSEIISSIAEKRKISKKIIISSLVGTFGLALFILPMTKFNQHLSVENVIIGTLLTIIMVIAYSVGNVLIGINKKLNSTPLYTQIAYGCSFGSLFLLIIILIVGKKFTFDLSSQYILSILYLIIIASVLAFVCLFYLITTIGSAKANYTSLVYPTIALITSSYFENYHFSFYGILGFVLIISALLMEFVPIKKFNKIYAKIFVSK